MEQFITIGEFPILLLTGLMTLVAFYVGKTMKFLRLPSLIGYMITGVLLGPSLFDFLSESIQQDMTFITDIALSFVAVSIGLELSFSSLRRLGKGIIIVIFSESFAAFILVTAAIYLLTKDLPLSLVFGSIAPASAPAGTVAVIQEYRAKGSLTEALYAVVGFDDGLGIIIFGFASAIAQSLLHAEMGGAAEGALMLFLKPMTEIILSIVIGLAMGSVYMFLAKILKRSADNLILLFAMTMITTGLCLLFGLSLILTNMLFGIIIVNTQSSKMISRIKNQLEELLPLIFVLFFVLAGANLHVRALPALGIIGLVYVLARSAGLMGGAVFGAVVGKMESKIKKYLGMGILSQAGVAIGLSLIVKQEFSGIGTHGAAIGSSVITTITATCIFFEIIGPILTKIGLERSGEIHIDHQTHD